MSPMYGACVDKYVKGVTVKVAPFAFPIPTKHTEMKYKYTLLLFNEKELMIATQEIELLHQLQKDMELTVDGGGGLVITLTIERINLSLVNGERVACCGMICQLTNEKDGELAVFPFSAMVCPMIKNSPKWKLRPSTGADSLMTSRRIIMKPDEIERWE